MPETGKERRWLWQAEGPYRGLQGVAPRDGEELMPVSEHEAALAKAHKEAVEAERNRRVGKIIQDRAALRKEGREEVREALLTYAALEAVCSEIPGLEPVHPEDAEDLRRGLTQVLDSLTKEGD